MRHKIEKDGSNITYFFRFFVSTPGSIIKDQMANREFNVPAKEVISVTKNSILSSYDSEFIVLAKIKHVKMVTLDKGIPREFPRIAFDLDILLSESE